MYILCLVSLTILARVSAFDLSVLLQSFDSFTTDLTTYVPEDAKLNITQLVEKYGYRIHEHSVVTEDGYIINFHRISNNDGVKSNNSAVVFLMHGILDSSDSWVLQGPGKALAYVLADHGFDVWLGNARGNKHALEHTKLNPKMPQFWEFNWEEIGTYDLPAMIDYILRFTGKGNLYYVGHSQGTTTGYVLLSMKPEYNSKIKMMFSLAPEAWMKNVKSPLFQLFSSTHGILGVLLKELNIYVTDKEAFFHRINALLCTISPVRCDNLLYAVTGSSKKINETLLPVIYGHIPTGSSILQFLHYGQLLVSGRFCRYDYGSETNLIKYGRDTPPDYNLSNIKVPMVIYYSDNDWLSDPKDVEMLKSHLSNVYGYIYLKDFVHMDYVYSYEAMNEVYTKIIKQIVKYDKSTKVNEIGFKHNINIEDIDNTTHEKHRLRLNSII